MIVFSKHVLSFKNGSDVITWVYLEPAKSAFILFEGTHAFLALLLSQQYK